MTDLEKKMENIVRRAAGEESSIFDIISEVRSESVEAGTYQEFVDSGHAAISILNRLHDQQEIGFYDDDQNEIDFRTALQSIYKTYAYVR